MKRQLKCCKNNDWNQGIILLKSGPTVFLIDSINNKLFQLFLAYGRANNSWFVCYSNLFSNTESNLQLCGPVAGIQFWVYNKNHQPSAPNHNYIPPPGYAPAGHGSYSPSGNKRNVASVLQPTNILLVTIIILSSYSARSTLHIHLY